MIHVTFEQSHVVWFVIVGAVALAATAIGYRTVFHWLRPRQWWSLFLLRTGAILFVLLLLLRPVVSLDRLSSHKPFLVIAVDASASMSIKDVSESQSRYEMARHTIQRWWPKLESDYDVKLIAFGENAAVLPAPATLPSRATAKATSIAAALKAAGSYRRQGNLEAVILFSDGRHNTVEQPSAWATRVGAPVGVIGVGEVAESDRADIRLTDLEHVPQFTVNNRSRMTAYVEAVGLPGQVVDVVLEQDGAQAATASLVLDRESGPQRVDLEFVPEQPGFHRYTVRVTAAPEERIRENNQRSVTVPVVDARIRVLYIEGTLRPEYGAITGRFLAKDPDIEYCALVQTRPNVFTQRSNIEGLTLDALPNSAEEWQPFDVVLLGDLDASYWTSQQMEQLVAHLRNGGGLLAMGGYHALGPGGYGGTPLEAALPLFLGSREIGQINDPFVPRLTAEGVAHPIFANIAEFFPSPGKAAAETGLPPLLGCVRVAGAKPSALVLAECPVADDEQGVPQPVLAVQPFGKGRTAVFTGDTTRNWQQALRAADEQSPFLRFWGQAIRYLAGRDGEVHRGAGIVAQTDAAFYAVNSRPIVTAIVRDGEGAGTDEARVTVRYSLGQRTRVVQLEPVEGRTGHYRAQLRPLPAGQHQLNVTAVVEGRELSADPIPIEVGRPNQEFDELSLGASLLQEIARSSGGRFVHVRVADEVLDWIKHERETRVVTAQFQLYWPPGCWLAVVGLLTSEWFLRRRYRLR